MSHYANQPLKPARHIIPFTKKEKALWNPEEKTIDLTIYNQSLIKTIKAYDAKEAEKKKQQEMRDWYKSFKQDQQSYADEGRESEMVGYERKVKV